ncbi:pseudoazurin [Neisseria chenwenguii]|uniref:Pseudoazurin n=1 Tax=Neisseria chenwenguii TaxID=1853278 RepID=A0A220S0C4_9NEIS|nr:pseudoazurin [Neisseria chenwenguii]ASK26816.1 pseudoazurin [Neisseria chenwenguii]ROV56794.1 pseudoazurin [Neisseria chenwenguii]
MQKSLFTLLLTASLSAFAANHEVKMLDNGKDGSMVFEPGFINAKVGDTVTFKPTHKGHWVQSKVLPEGVGEFLSKADQEFILKLTKEGVYVYTCPPHRMMNMSGVIQVGKAVNKAQAQAAADELEKRSMQNKGRLKKYMSQVK